MALPRFTSLAVSGAALAAMIAYVEIPATSPALARVPDTPAIAAGAAAAPGTKAAEPGLEGSLAALVDDIEANRLDSAMQRVDRLIDEYPKFRLAHLIKGDLLLARAGPLSEFGQGGKSKAWEQVADLREEAIARLRGMRSKPPIDEIPRDLMELAAEQRHAVVVDTQRSRLYLYENDHGRPRFVADYYISQGKLGADKSREGDKKTPLGVYHVTASLPAGKLPEFYGAGAFPINYPNEWDRRHGRDGSGIWLHGTPPDTYSRPPRASDGCVVLANRDLGALAAALQVGITPVLIGQGVEWRREDDWRSERNELRAAFDAWQTDWESRDLSRYAAHYSPRFSTGGVNQQEWLSQKARVNAGKTWINVETHNVSMLRNPGRDEYVVVSFDQEYRSNNLSNRMRKRQYWQREEGRWRIVYEGAA